jgi:hypothetical protein
METRLWSSDRMPELVPTAADLRVLAKTRFDTLLGNPHLRLSETHRGQRVAARNVLIMGGRASSQFIGRDVQRTEQNDGV